jgi:type III secretory pathway component EscS
MQQIATKIFIIASVAFGVLGVTSVLTQARDDSIIFRLLLVTVFIILPSFALSVAGKYLKPRS